MELYLVIVEDRHTDTTVHVFSEADKAISAARRLAKQYNHYPEDYAEHDYGKREGWLFYADYSSEGDSVRVVSAVLDVVP